MIGLVGKRIHKKLLPKIGKRAVPKPPTYTKSTYVLQPDGLRVSAWTKGEAVAEFKRLLKVRELGAWRVVRKAAV